MGQVKILDSQLKEVSDFRTGSRNFEQMFNLKVSVKIFIESVYFFFSLYTYSVTLRFYFSLIHIFHMILFAPVFSSFTIHYFLHSSVTHQFYIILRISTNAKYNHETKLC